MGRVMGGGMEYTSDTMRTRLPSSVQCSGV